MSPKSMDRIRKETLESWSKPEFWKHYCSLDIEGKASTSSKTIATQSSKAPYRCQIKEQGYALVNDPIPTTIIKLLRDGMMQLQRAKLPASFIFLFDVAWDLARISQSVLEANTSDSVKFQSDFLAWHIDGSDSGFAPHRDRQPEKPRDSFDGEDPKFVTHWIAISDASPKSSCLYVIPKTHDPGYTTGDQSDDPLRDALASKEAYQHIRALPRPAGTSLLFSHRIIHWGSTRDPAAGPRLTISFVAADPSFEAPYLDLPDCPSFHQRLLLVCAQLLIYYQRFDFGTDFLSAIYEYCRRHSDNLDETYWRKVTAEFVRASREQAEPDEEQMLEAMLDNAQDFSDDYGDDSGDEQRNYSDEEEDEGVQEYGTSLFGTDSRKRSRLGTE